MRLRLPIILILALVGVSFADGLLVNPYRFTAPGGPTYFFAERFEGTGYQNTWTEFGTGTVNEDYTTSPLEGSQSLLISGTAQQPTTSATLPAGNPTEVWIFFKMRVDTAVNGTRDIASLRDSGSVTLGTWRLTSANLLGCKHGAAGSVATVDALTPTTTYNVWGHWKASTGSNNGQMSIGFSTGTTEVTGGNAFAAQSNGTTTNGVAFLSLGFNSLNTTGVVVFDMILISNTGTIGDNPL